MVTQRVAGSLWLLTALLGSCAVSGATPQAVDGGFTFPAQGVDAAAAEGGDEPGADGESESDADGEPTTITDGADDVPGRDDAGSAPTVPDASTRLDAGIVEPPPLPPSTCTGDAGVSSATDIGLFVKYKVGGDGPLDQEVKPHVMLENRGSETLSLSELTLTYWFTREGAGRAIVFECDYAALGCAVLRATSGDACGTGVDTYLRIAFSSGQLAPGASTGEMQLRLHKDDYSSFDETNDYSYGGSVASFTEYARISVMRGDELVWGELPY